MTSVPAVAGRGVKGWSRTMSYHETASVSRATSVSRASKHGSTLSRSQSLIKKNVAPQDLKPSDVLIERFVAWKAIVKQLIAYFEGLADIQNNIAREYTKLRAVIQVPFKAGNQFLGEGGLQARIAPSYTMNRCDVRHRMCSIAYEIKPGSLLTNMPTSVVPSTARLCSIFRSLEQRSKPISRCDFSHLRVVVSLKICRMFKMIQASLPRVSLKSASSPPN